MNEDILIRLIDKLVAERVNDIISRSNNPASTNEPIMEIKTVYEIFVIISYHEDMDPIFEGMKAAGERYGLNFLRVKDVFGDYRISEKIMSMINESKFVIADLTHERPNVYFELGYARGIGKTVITTARKGTNVHFDVHGWPCIFYDDSRVLEKQLDDRFQSKLVELLTA